MSSEGDWFLLKDGIVIRLAALIPQAFQLQSNLAANRIGWLMVTKVSPNCLVIALLIGRYKSFFARNIQGLVESGVIRAAGRRT